MLHTLKKDVDFKRYGVCYALATTLMQWNTVKKTAIEHIEIPYQENSCEIFDAFHDLPGAVFLDSSSPYSRAGRYDIITAMPDQRAPKPQHFTDITQWLEAARQYISQHWNEVTLSDSQMPFCGGFLGYFEYEAGNALVKLAPCKQKDNSRVGAYHWALIQDHHQQKSCIIFLSTLDPETKKKVLHRLNDPKNPKKQSFNLLQPFKSNMSEAQYCTKFEQAQRYINAGDCYQVNLAQRFTSQYQGEPWIAYRALREVAKAPYSAYMNIDNGALLCLSPEQFMHCRDRNVHTSPIKGTRPRDANPAKDQALADALYHSPKDRAENLMIVDLLRNDLGRVCRPGSIAVDALFKVQSFATVHHLVSTISGELSDGVDTLDLLGNSFPGGSITGAPKRRAMEIIAELEPHPRQIFCGSLFYLSAHGVMDSNILIRSLLCRDGDIHAWAGGGLVADSTAAEEFRECSHKISPLLKRLENETL